FQVQTNIPIAGASVVNAGNASIDGVEGQFAFKATENWEFSTAFTYLDARLDDDVILANGTLVAGNAGDALPATPSWQASVSAQYDKPLSIGEDLEAYGRVDLYHTGSAINGTNASVALFGAQTATPETIPSYESGYLSFGVRKKDDWQIWLAVNNFWDEQAVTWIAPRFSDGRSYALRPREFVLGFYKPF
ncbi:MAG: TonB-dependent receptor, partial [Pseudomonadota bacterium]